MVTPCTAVVVETATRLLVAWHGGIPAARERMGIDFAQTFTHRDATWRKADRCWTLRPQARERLHAFLAAWVAPENVTWVQMHPAVGESRWQRSWSLSERAG